MANGHHFRLGAQKQVGGHQLKQGGELYQEQHQEIQNFLM
jgi:hypothetical protein